MHRLCSLFACLFCAWTSLADESPRYQFRDGAIRTFTVDANSPDLSPRARDGETKTLRIRSEQHPDQVFESTDRIALQLKGGDLQKLLKGSGLEVIQQVNEHTFVLQAPDALTAAREAARLANRPETLNATPVMRSLNVGLQAPQAPRPTDPLFPGSWHLENTSYPGVDLNARGGWFISLGEGVTMAIADQAIDLAHPELTSRSAATHHYNFINNSTNLTLSAQDNHATSVAGLALATMNNGIGIVGLAPQSSFANWRIFSTNGAITDDQQLMNMFQYRSNTIAVQNHSWASTTRSLYSIGFLSRMGIDAAIQNGRNGKGIVMVRSAGNRRLGGFEGGAYREISGNANDDGFAADPNVIVVAAARANGRVTRYSSPGANILVAGLSSESPKEDTTAIANGFPALLTTARGGGYTNFSGTSAAVPQISGIASLILSANTNLTYRDVQQILLLSSRHFDLNDPDLRTNGAGLAVSHNLGFGIPDAQRAVLLAKAWNNRPSRTQLNFLQEEEKTIPDQGFLVRATGADIPGGLFSIAALMPKEERHPDFAPGEMFRPDSPTQNLPAVYVGQATTTIAQDLTGKVALIQRGGGASFFEKVNRAEQAGAAAAVIFNNAGDDLILMNMTNFVSIPCTFIGQTAGDALVSQSETNAELRLQLRLNTANYAFQVSNQLSLEHVAVKVRTENLRRSDIRITLTSPSGTRSILQRVNNDPSTNAPIDWTYVSTQHFYESSVGTWTVQFSDELAGAVGVVKSVELQLLGVPITDVDADGLDDNWETARFGNLQAGPDGDPDQDGLTNLEEFLLNTDPTANNGPVIVQHPP
ncbi:MAG: S8 family serine peptidase, partial [Limisphaerales bacterium]